MRKGTKIAAARGKSSGPSSRSAAPAARWNNALISPDHLAQAKRLAVIRAAGHAFKAKGFHHTTLDDVAAGLNVTKPTLYYYVSGKQDLLFQCYSYALDIGEQSLEAGRGGASGWERLRLTLHGYIVSLIDEFPSNPLLSDLSDLLPEQRRAIQQRRRRFDAIYRQYVSEGIADGSIRACDEKMAVFWLMGSVNAIPRWYSSAGPYSGPEIARIFLDFIARGLGAAG